MIRQSVTVRIASWEPAAGTRAVQCYYRAASSSELSERSRRRRAPVKIRCMTSLGPPTTPGLLTLQLLLDWRQSAARRCLLQLDRPCHSGCLSVARLLRPNANAYMPLIAFWPTDHFSRPGRRIGCACVCVCPDDIWSRVFGVLLVHLNTI